MSRMTKEINKLTEKIVSVRRRLLKACVDHDENKMIKLQHKILKLNLKLNGN